MDFSFFPKKIHTTIQNRLKKQLTTLSQGISVFLSNSLVIYIKKLPSPQIPAVRVIP